MATRKKTKKATRAKGAGRPKGSTKFNESLVKTVGVRMQRSMLDRIDAYAEAMRERDPIRGAAQADAIRELLDKALTTFERRR